MSRNARLNRLEKSHGGGGDILFNVVWPSAAAEIPPDSKTPGVEYRHFAKADAPSREECDRVLAVKPLESPDSDFRECPEG